MVSVENDYLNNYFNPNQTASSVNSTRTFDEEISDDDNNGEEFPSQNSNIFPVPKSQNVPIANFKCNGESSAFQLVEDLNVVYNLKHNGDTNTFHIVKDQNGEVNLKRNGDASIFSLAKDQNVATNFRHSGGANTFSSAKNQKAAASSFKDSGNTNIPLAKSQNVTSNFKRPDDIYCEILQELDNDDTYLMSPDKSESSELVNTSAIESNVNNENSFKPPFFLRGNNL